MLGFLNSLPRTALLRSSASKRCAVPDEAHWCVAFRWRPRDTLTRAVRCVWINIEVCSEWGNALSGTHRRFQHCAHVIRGAGAACGSFERRSAA
eukprot:7179829-Alexandrium_andersonii.AAC.1